MVFGETPPATTPKQSTPVVQLDVIRALAVWLVMFRHGGHAVRDSLHIAPLDFMARGGWIGVDIFFVLSGFLVSGLLFREQQRHGSISYSRFIIRRGLKIYPAFYVFLAISIAIASMVGWRNLVERSVAEALFVQNYFQGIWSHTWSLAVEEHFYIAIPIVLIVIHKLTGRRKDDPFRAFVLFAFIVMLCVLALRLSIRDEPYSLRTHYMLTHLRIDGLTFGVVLSYVYHYHPQLFARAKPYAVLLLVFGVACLAPNFLVDITASPFINTWGFTLNYLGAGALLVGCLMLPFGESRLVGGIGAVGSYSYSLYLWHIPIAVGMGRVYSFSDPYWSDLQQTISLPDLNYLMYIAYFLVATAFGIGMAKLVEIPVLHYRDRLFPSRSGAILPQTKQVAPLDHDRTSSFPSRVP